MRYILLLLIAGLIAGCSTVKHSDELLAEPVIYTARDNAANFSDYLTFYISDTIGLVDGDHPDDSTLIGADSKAVVDQIKKNMTDRGYSFDASLDTGTDLGVSVTLMRNLLDDYYYGGYWNYYYNPYYYYWYGWYGWYYPYYYPYVIYVPTNQGTIIIDLVDLKNAHSAEKFVVIWNAIISGYLDANNNINLQRAVEAVDQSFTQSPYLKH